MSDDALAFDASDCTSFDVPIYILAGAHDETCDGLPREWFDAVSVPVKGFYAFDVSAHSPLFEEPDRAVDIMVGDVLSGTNDEAYGR